MLEKLGTEQINGDTVDIDKVSTLEMLAMINAEDKKVAFAVEAELPSIAAAVDMIADNFEKHGRLVYIGAGTSGRLGILDASECMPTFGIGDDMVKGIIAGGETAVRNAVEGAEDDFTLAEKDLKNIHFRRNDTLVGIAASGRTPYVIGGLKYAKSVGAKTIGIACVKASELSVFCDIAIEVLTGPEAITGSTRMKAGTAQKMVLNMLSTGSMVKIGKVYGNLMVDVLALNAKLKHRAQRIVSEITGENDNIEKLLAETGYNIKEVIFMIKTNSDKVSAAEFIEKAGGVLDKAIKLYYGAV